MKKEDSKTGGGLTRKRVTMVLVGTALALASVFAGVRYFYLPYGKAEKRAAKTGVDKVTGEKASVKELAGSSQGNRREAANSLTEAHGEAHDQMHNQMHNKMTGPWELTVSTLESIQDKIHTLRVADQTSERLKLENANLRLRVESLEFNCKAQDGKQSTERVEMKLSHDSGSKVGRTLSAIRYTPPSHLLPGQLYTLGVSYFKAREDEKAAVIFTFLTSLEDSEEFKTPRNHLMTGIAWYRLDNYDLADQYFDKVLKSPVKDDSVKYIAQSRLWKGLTAGRLGKHTKEQFWLKELVDYHPNSLEAKWINGPMEVKRVPASE